MNQTLVFEKISSATGINIISWMDLLPFVIVLGVIAVFIYSVIKKKKKKQKVVVQPKIHEDIFEQDNKLVMWQQRALQTELYRIKETGKALEQSLLQKKNEMEKVNENISEINYKLRLLKDKYHNYIKQLELIKR